MADLQVLYKALGFSQVTTYIQSGNVVFTADADAARVTNQIEQAIRREYGFEVPVLVFTAAECNSVLTTIITPYHLAQ